MMRLRWNYFKQSKAFLNSVKISYTTRSGILKLSDEVQEAVTSKKALVALESTIITHGMPYPDNLRTALSVERKVRESGAVPATIAVLKGKICVGLDEADLIWLAEKNNALLKVSRRDLPFVLSQGLSGGTTVSATMIAAHMAGIHVFATGGIGGVHRGAETSFDISADLTELGRTPVVVVSSGVKSILDIPKTLEYLETQGVCVVIFGEQRNFPAFFTRDSGYLAAYNTATHLDAAKMIDTHHKSSLSSGILIAVPIPAEFAATGDLIQQAIDKAVQLARENNITGKEVTPYILNVVNELTKGQSLVANVALVENNASVAGGIANCLAQIQAGVSVENITLPSQIQSLSCSTSLSRSTQSAHVASAKNLNGDGGIVSEKTGSTLLGRPLVIGATVIDFSVQVGDPNLQFNGGTYKGTVSQSFGGVGRNLADCLGRLDCNPVFISAMGNDNLSSAVSQHCKHIDMHLVQTLDNMTTATYCPVLLASGQLLFGVGNMDINSHFTVNKVPDLDLLIKSAPLVVLDGNFTPEVIEMLVLKCRDMSIPVWFEPTDLFKSVKPFETGAWRHLTFISPNLGELVSMYRALAKHLGHNQRELTAVDILQDSAKLEDIIQVSVQMCLKMVTYIPVIMVTLGKHGVLLCHNFGDISRLLPLPPVRSVFKNQQFRATYYRTLDFDTGNSNIVSVSGAGDCLASAFIAGMLRGFDMELCMKQGLLAATLSLQSSSAVPDSISATTILKVDADLVFSSCQPVDVSNGLSGLM